MSSTQTSARRKSVMPRLVVVRAKRQRFTSHRCPLCEHRNATHRKCASCRALMHATPHEWTCGCSVYPAPEHSHLCEFCYARYITMEIPELFLDEGE